MRLLNSFDIEQLCRRHDIKMNHIYCRDEIPQHLHDGWYILNLDRASGAGTHWCTFMVNNGNNNNLYFDSFGFPPPNELEHLLKTYTYNTKKIQDLNSDSCGWFCLMAIKYCEDRGNGPRPFNQFLSLFSDKSTINEKILENFFRNDV